MRRLALIAVLLALAAPAAAEERITNFDSAIAVQRDGTVDVIETIGVVAEGNAIRHGIFRDFPTRYRGRGGQVMHVRFTLLGTTLDGREEPSVTEPLSNGVRVRIGSAEREIEPGEHRYAVHYRATREIGRFDAYDELYWNVTGNGWRFPIDRAAATITLPSPARFCQRALYTGVQGSTASAATVTAEAPGRIAVATTAPLGPYEGLTVAVAFPKGVIAAPSGSDRVGWWLADQGPPLVGVAGLAGVLAYLFYAWRRVGRDPRAGTVVPLFSPPEEMTPAGMRYVSKMKLDNRGFAAALVDLGVRGHLRLIEKDGGWLSKDERSVERLPSTAPLSGPEGEMLDALVQPGGSIEMKQENHSHFSSAINKLNEGYKAIYENQAFHRNLGWAAGAVALLVAAVWLAAAAVLLAEGDGGSAAMIVGSAGMAIASALLFGVVARSKAVGKCLFSALAFVLAAGAALIALPVIPAALNTGNFVPMLIPALALPFVLSSFWWISAPTAEGRQLLDQIAGFKQYLSIAEGPRLDRMTRPAETIKTFEKYLPYAIALGVENQWAGRFQAMLAAAAAQGQGQAFGWYSGNHSPWNDAGGFASSVGSSLASTVSAASTAPGSSSGSGGGGSSGGGGGGGGGGGW